MASLFLTAAIFWLVAGRGVNRWDFALLDLCSGLASRFAVAACG